jgi:arylsulfatase
VGNRQGRFNRESFTVLRVPKLFNLRTDPFERADHNVEHVLGLVPQKGYMIMAAQAVVTPFLNTFKEFPPRQKAATFTIDQAIEKMESSLKDAA